MSDLLSPEAIGAAMSKTAVQLSLLQLAFSDVYISGLLQKTKRLRSSILP
jgi:hypothetical protein